MHASAPLDKLIGSHMITRARACVDDASRMWGNWNITI
jgi:hypothetical protein